MIELPAPVPKIAAAPLPTMTPIATPTHHDAICAYLETVHVVFNSDRWESLRKELLERLTGEPDHLCEWLRDQRIVFPGCEQEVAERLTALMQRNPDESPKRVSEPSPVRKPRGEVIPFRRPDTPVPAFENAAVSQLALF